MQWRNGDEPWQLCQQSWRQHQGGMQETKPDQIHSSHEMVVYASRDVGTLSRAQTEQVTELALRRLHQNWVMDETRMQDLLGGHCSVAGHSL